MPPPPMPEGAASMMVTKVIRAISVSEWSNGLNSGLCLHICAHAQHNPTQTDAN